MFPTSDPDVKCLVKVYAPAKEVIFNASGLDDGMSNYRVRILNQLSPPEAYVQLKREM